jgi:hypothetical protein
MPADTNFHVCNFIFSPQEIDVAIVALDAYDYETGVVNIPKILFERGYRPIDISDIDTGYQPKKLDKTYSIGFPDLSMIGIKNSEDTFQIFQSNRVSAPIVSRGNILDTNHPDPYVISDVFVYHGNSGGPIIHNNKLIGIVHGPNLERREVSGTVLRYYLFLNGNQFIKSKYIMPLLRQFVSLIKYNKSILKLQSK